MVKVGGSAGEEPHVRPKKYSSATIQPPIVRLCPCPPGFARGWIARVISILSSQSHKTISEFNVHWLEMDC